MNTILTDDERPKLPMPRIVRGTNPHCYSDLDMEAYADAREAAVIEKLAQQEPVAWWYMRDVEQGISFSPDQDANKDWQPLYTHPAPQQADRLRVPEGWRELCRRLYVELFYCDQQMTSGKRPKWKQGETVRDVLADAKAALEAAAPEAPAQASAVDERDRKDAERYRFIRNADRSDPHLPHQALMAYACESFDEAIDDAMEEEVRAALAQKGQK
jgi:hypothetical protein